MLGFLVTLIGTGYMRCLALKKQWLDIPSSRSSHTEITPRGGGVAIVAAFIVFSAFQFYVNALLVPVKLGLLVVPLIIAAVGFADDLYHLSAKKRLFFYTLSSVMAIGLLEPIRLVVLFSVLPDSVYLGAIFTLFYLLWSTNLFNFMDGIDGIAGIEAVSVLGLMSILMLIVPGYYDAFGFSLQLFVAISTLGFLIWNWPPAKIFMGDAGSAFLGFFIATLSLYLVSVVDFPIWSIWILYGVFIVDATYTLLQRFLRKDVVHEAHCRHAYQKLSKAYNSHKKVTVGVLLINLFWLFPWAYLAILNPAWGWLYCGLAYCPLVVICIYTKAGQPDNRASLNSAGA